MDISPSLSRFPRLFPTGRERVTAVRDLPPTRPVPTVLLKPRQLMDIMERPNEMVRKPLIVVGRLIRSLSRPTVIGRFTPNRPSKTQTPLLLSTPKLELLPSLLEVRPKDVHTDTSSTEQSVVKLVRGSKISPKTPLKSQSILLEPILLPIKNAGFSSPLIRPTTVRVSLTIFSGRGHIVDRRSCRDTEIALLKSLRRKPSVPSLLSPPIECPPA